MLAGVLLGILLPILFGFVWIEVDPGHFGFGSGGLILLASFLTAAPSAAGGAAAG